MMALNSDQTRGHAAEEEHAQSISISIEGIFFNLFKQAFTV
jgi:hypothetical protein